MKDKKILFGTFIALLLLLTTGLSYAYFSASISGNENAKNVVVEAGTLSLVYTDGPEIKVENIRPGKTITKEVTVKNTGTLDTNYNIVWQSLVNEIINDELVLSATCQRLNSAGTVEGTCNSIPQAPISDMTIARKISIESGITHKYTFTILFKDTNTNQNYNQGKKFSGVLGIEETSRFTLDDWNTIVENVKVRNTGIYKVGDTKTVDLGTYGTHTLRVANTSTPSECNTSGFSQTACGFVLEFADIITDHKMNDTTTNVGGWPATSMRTFVNNDIYNAIPSEIKNAIINTTVVSGHGDTSGETNFTSTDKLYLLAPKEIYTDFNDTDDTAKNLTRTLDYYTAQGVTTSNKSGAIKKNGTRVDWWWLRTASSSDDYNFYGVGSSGDNSKIGAGASRAVVPAFRLG